MSTSGNVRVRASSAVFLLLISAVPATDACATDSPYDLATQRALARDELRPSTTVAPSVVDDRVRAASQLSVLDADTVPSPGITIGITSYDIQHYYAQGHQVATNPGSETVHFAWTMWDEVPDDIESINRFASYNSWDKPSGSTNQGFNGTAITLGEFARGGFVRIDVNSNNLCHATLHQRIEQDYPYSVWHLHFPIEGSALHLDRELQNASQYYIYTHLWPDIAVEQKSPENADMYHIISLGADDYWWWTDDRIWYWRYDAGAPAPDWEGPVLIDSTWTLSYTIDAADDSGKVAIALTSHWSTDNLNGLNNVVYRESHTGGTGWLNGSELGEAFKNFVTTYADDEGPRAWTETSTAYDHRGVLHIIFTEQRAPGSIDIAVKHWSNERGTVRTVTEAYYDNPNTWGRTSNIAQISLGIGDGATWCQGGAENNADYLYVLYTQLGGDTPEEQADTSALGLANGELYLTASDNGGFTWSRPTNLTNSRTPDCNSANPDSLCSSEAWGTLARDVSDIEILYIRDFEAGAFDEAPWSLNRAKYLNLPGGTTDVQYVCPVIAPWFDADITRDTDCEYHTYPGGVNLELLTLSNRGNADMVGNIVITSGGTWLSVGSPGAYTILNGGPDLDMMVIMNAGALTEGFYLGVIEISHNDTSQTSPFVIPIEFFVANQFFCPEDRILRTAVASAGVVSLQIGSDGRFGAPHPEGGMWRYLDSSRSIGDATLLIAHGTQEPDTTVFHRFYERSDPGQYGFRSVGSLLIDTSRYGTGGDYAWSLARMTTKDSLLGVDVHWLFPQHPDSADLVIAKYVVTNRTESPLTDIAVAVYADLDVIASAHIRYYRWPIQTDVDNFGYYHAPLNLLYQYGHDTIDHVPYEYLESSQRYSGGITYIAGRDYAGDGESFANEGIPLRGLVGDNRDNSADGGPTSGHLYRSITGPPGVPIFVPYPHNDSTKNLYTSMTLDQGLTLAPGESRSYVIGLVSDTLEHFAYGPAPTKSFGATGLEDVVLRAWQWASDHAFCICPCLGDPLCDGLTNVLDVVYSVNVAFRSVEAVYDYDCQFARTDVSCDGVTDVTDVVRMVDVAFRGGDPATVFCDPCAP